ncbi:MAG: polysaccharide deacetylase family protein [Candidatus Omnitrophica bacterium]|nr:polysaccharide deacetylase family protein [Candidatus Omnitrophota bacterium]
MKKIAVILLALIILLGAFYFFWFIPKYTVPILAYHSINYKEKAPFVSPENFTKQLEYIKKKGYEVITLDELVESIKNKKRLKRNKVVITFDDGYKDNFEYAYPILKKFGFPATVFLVTDYIGNDKRFLNWDQVRFMSKNNISFGGHTKGHYYLGTVKDDKVAWEQIAGPKEAIEKEIGAPADYFCYPTGGFNARVKEIVEEAGYKGACTTNRGFARFNNDVYELKRVKISNSDAVVPFSFWAKLSGYYDLLRRKKKPY